MKNRSRLLLGTAALSVLAGSGWTYLQLAGAGAEMTLAGQRYAASLSPEQKVQGVLEFSDTPKRVDWHFIPKDSRKGIQIKNMKDEQRKAALALLRSSLSETGYHKATKIMELERVLHELEKTRQGPIRDPERYYFTLFGQPAEDGRWGLSVEGHHLSLNFVIENNRIASSTPTFFGANPATFHDDIAGIEKGTRVLAKEEQLAFDLVNALNDEQQQKAVIAETAPREIRDAGSPQPPADEKVGISYAELNDEQQRTMRELVTEYAGNVPQEVRRQRLAAIRDSGPENVRFAWAGSLKPGVGHYYRVQGPTFLIEFVNTQPDSAGNPANHIHSVWRDMHGDFAIPIAAE